MDPLLNSAFIVIMRKLPVIVSLIKDNALTSPVSIEEVYIDGVATIVAANIDLLQVLNTAYPDELTLLTAVEGHCKKEMYLLIEGELKIFTLSRSALALKRITDTARSLGLSQLVIEKLLDLLINDDTYEWINEDD